MQYGVVQSAARVCSSLRKTHEHGSLPPTPEQHVGCRAYRDGFTCRTGLHLQTKAHVRKLCIFLVIHRRDRIHCLHITLNMNKQITLLISRKKKLFSECVPVSALSPLESIILHSHSCRPHANMRDLTDSRHLFALTVALTRTDRLFHIAAAAVDRCVAVVFKRHLPVPVLGRLELYKPETQRVSGGL